MSADATPPSSSAMAARPAGESNLTRLTGGPFPLFFAVSWRASRSLPDQDIGEPKKAARSGRIREFAEFLEELLVQSRLVRDNRVNSGLRRLCMSPRKRPRWRTRLARRAGRSGKAPCKPIDLHLYSRSFAQGGGSPCPDRRSKQTKNAGRERAEKWNS